MHGRVLVIVLAAALAAIPIVLFTGCPPGGGMERELKWDDGMQDGKMSIAGSGHAVKFTCPAGKSSLTQIKLYSERYGRPNDSNGYSIYILDNGFKQIKRIDGNYQDFTYATEGWRVFDMKPPVKVPKEFWICFVFNPEMYFGVYVFYDRGSSGHSRTGTPMSDFNTDPGYDWMIRAYVK